MLIATQPEGQAKTLTLNNLIANWQGAKRVGAFSEQNMKLLRVGRSAILDNGVLLEVDHIVPVYAAKGTARVLANLRLTPFTLNRSMQETVTEGVSDYARRMKDAGLMTLPEFENVEGSVKYAK